MVIEMQVGGDLTAKGEVAMTSPQQRARALREASVFDVIEYQGAGLYSVGVVIEDESRLGDVNAEFYVRQGDHLIADLEALAEVLLDRLDLAYKGREEVHALYRDALPRRAHEGIAAAESVALIGESPDWSADQGWHESQKAVATEFERRMAKIADSPPTQSAI